MLSIIGINGTGLKLFLYFIPFRCNQLWIRFAFIICPISLIKCSFNVYECHVDGFPISLLFSICTILSVFPYSLSFQPVWFIYAGQFHTFSFLSIGTKKFSSRSFYIVPVLYIIYFLFPFFYQYVPYYLFFHFPTYNSFSSNFFLIHSLSFLHV